MVSPSREKLPPPKLHTIIDIGTEYHGTKALWGCGGWRWSPACNARDITCVSFVIYAGSHGIIGRINMGTHQPGHSPQRKSIARRHQCQRLDASNVTRQCSYLLPFDQDDELDERQTHAKL